MARLHATTVMVLILLVFAEWASAECAWVLWEEQIRLRFPGKESDPPMSGSTSWKLIQATAEAECRRALAAEVSARSRPSQNREIEVGENGFHETLFHVDDGQRRLVSMTTFRYLCIPDTIDPREPESK